MEKKWIVYAEGCGLIGKKPLDTYEAAELKAKQTAADQRYAEYPISIYQLIAHAKAQVPEIEIVKVS